LLPIISILYILGSISVAILLHAWALVGLVLSGVQLIVKLSLKVVVVIDFGGNAQSIDAGSKLVFNIHCNV
jgi:hypothetical protein